MPRGVLGINKRKGSGCYCLVAALIVGPLETMMFDPVGVGGVLGSYSTQPFWLGFNV